MPRITDNATTFNDLDLHILPLASTPPVDDDGNGYGGTNAGNSSTITQVADLIGTGDLSDVFNTFTYHDHGSRREQVGKTFKSVQEFEIILPFRPSEAAQTAIVNAFNSVTDQLILAVIAGNGKAIPDEDQMTFTCIVTNYTNMLSKKEERADCSFTVNIVGDVAYAARTT